MSLHVAPTVPLGMPSHVAPTAPLTSAARTDERLRHAAELAREGDHQSALAEVMQFTSAYDKDTISVEAVQATSVAIRLCNELALACMNELATSQQLDSAYAYLKWALKAPHASPALRAVTLNNASIFYARTGNPHAALRCLQRIGRQGSTMIEDDVSVHMLLNMTTVLADLGRNADALEKAQDAVRMLAHSERSGRLVDPSLLSAAHHNLAVQQERLGIRNGSVRSYRAAVLHARKGGIKSQPMATFMEQAYTSARSRAVQPRALRGSLLPPLQRPSRHSKLSSLGHAKVSPAVCVDANVTEKERRLEGPHFGALPPQGPTQNSAATAPASSPVNPLMNLEELYTGASVHVAPEASAITQVPLAGPPSIESLHAPRSASTAALG